MYLSVVGLSDVPVLLFTVTGGSFTVLVPGRVPRLSRIPSRRLPTLASPSAFSPSRAGSAHLSMSEPCLSWNFVPCCGPISRCPRERPLPEDRDPPSADGCHTAGHAPSSWFLTTSTVSSVHELRHVAAGTGSGFARFSAGRSSKPKLLGPGPSSPLALHPAKVCSSSAAVPHRCGLLPSCRSFRPRPKTKWTLERLDPSLPTSSFPTWPPTPGAVFRPPFGDGSVAPLRRPSVREQVAPPSCATCAWTVSIPRLPGWVSPTPWSPRGDPVIGSDRVSVRLSPTGSCDPTSFDLGLRVGHRCPILAPFRWWPSAPTLFLQGPASIASCPRPP